MSGVVEVALFTDAVRALTDFYARVLGTAPESEWPGGATFVVGDLAILVHERGGGGDDGPPNEDHVAVGVGDLAAACALAQQGGAQLVVEPREYPWGRSAYLRDPDGRLVELAERSPT